MIGMIFFLAALLNPDLALEKLVEGNLRFSENKPLYSQQENAQRSLLVSGQEPFAVILSCSDSRAPPEILFDQGLGELFVVRVAGNVMGPLELESIEYGVGVLHASLILVLGHENCGAVKAVCQGEAKSIPFIAKQILPAVDGCKGNLEKAVKDNVKSVVMTLKNTKHFAELIEKGELKVIGGYYNLESGKVNFF